MVDCTQMFHFPHAVTFKTFSQVWDVGKVARNISSSTDLFPAIFHITMKCFKFIKVRLFHVNHVVVRQLASVPHAACWACFKLT